MSAVSYDPLSHSRHNAGDRSTKVGHAINVVFTEQLITSHNTADSGVVYYFGRVCLSDDNFRLTGWEVHFCTSGIPVSPGNIVKFVYEGHWVKVKVTGAKKGRGRKSIFPQCKISIGYNFGSIKHRAMRFACNMGFSATTDRMV